MELLKRLQRASTRIAAEDDMDGRHLSFQGAKLQGDTCYVPNCIKTSKYTVYDFLPRNLFEQLRRPANFYFVVLAILQVIPAISISGGVPSFLFPLSFVMGVSAIKDAIEDKKRHEQDDLVNNRTFAKVDPSTGDIEDCRSSDLKVGDIVRITDEQMMPADILVLMCGKPETAQYCYVETSNIDGETNLKIKQTPESSGHFTSVEDFKNFNVDLAVEDPTAQLDVFSGTAMYDVAGKEKSIPLSLDHLLLRGCTLKNSDFVYGIVLYTGAESKIFKNASERQTRIIPMSSVEKRMNKMIFYMFILQCIICFFAGLFAGLWQEDHGHDWYLLGSDIEKQDAAVSGVERFFTWFIIFASFVPISLLVSLELVKFGQALFIQADNKMMKRQQTSEGSVTRHCDVQTLALNEELGQIEYLFSDKTGTLTCNQLDFRKCVIGKRSYGQGETEISRAAQRRKAYAELHEAEQEFEAAKKSGKPCQFKPVLADYLPKEAHRDVIELPHVNFDERDRIHRALLPLFAGEASLKITRNGHDPEVSTNGHLHVDVLSESKEVSVSANEVSVLPNDASSTPNDASSPDDVSPTPNDVISLNDTSSPNDLSPTPNDVSPLNDVISLNVSDLNDVSTSPAVTPNGASSSPTRTPSNVSSSSNDDEKDDAMHAMEVKNFLLALALDNTCFPVQGVRCTSCETVNSKGASRCKVDDKDLAKTGVDHLGLKAASPDDEALVSFSNFLGVELFSLKQPEITLRVTPPGGGEVMYERYEELALLDFTSKRKRMTRVVKDLQTNKVLVFMKGADSACLPLLSGKSQPNLEYTQRMLDAYSNQGLRTLFVCRAEKDIEWWEGPGGMKERYDAGRKEFAIEGESERGHFKGSCSHDCKRCTLERGVERSAGMDLIGATAIEDRLQDDVPETIQAMLDGGIRVWMLTGDKMETAINIGTACSFVDADMDERGALFRLDGNSAEKVTLQIDDFLERASVITKPLVEAREQGKALTRAEKNKYRSALVLSGKSFSQVVAAESDELDEKFVELATRCQSVVACRLQPNQKARIVKMIRDKKNVICMAVGDGANDEPMIRQANVGVGIFGVEGTAAVRASDYAIAQFSFLRRLIFLHGSLSYRRITDLICYIFYKNALYSLSILWFGTVSGVSGQPLQLEWFFQLYNIALTALPIIVYGLMDRQLRFETHETHPEAYRTRLKGKLFSYRQFALWILDAVVHSLVCLFVAVGAYYGLAGAADNDPHSAGLFSMGFVVYASIVFIVNLRLIFITYSWTLFHEVTVFASLALFFIGAFVLASSPIFVTAGADYTGLPQFVLGSSRMWLTLCLSIVLALLADFTVTYVQRWYFPTAYDQLRELDFARRMKRDVIPPASFLSIP